MLLWSVILASLSLSHVSGQIGEVDDAVANSSLLWGTYRPNLYVGLRPRLPESLSFGLVWYGIDEYTSFARARHTCEQDDGLIYAWSKHDGRSHGTQVIRDQPNNARLEASFLKVPGGARGGSWALRIKGTPLNADRRLRLGLVPYFGLEGDGEIQLDAEEDESGLEGDIKLTGSSVDLGAYSVRLEAASSNQQLRLRPGSGGQPSDTDFVERINRWNYLGVRTAPGTVWRAKDYILQDVSTNLQKSIEETGPENKDEPAALYLVSNDVGYSSNLFAFQHNFEGPFELDIYFDSGDIPSRLNPAGVSAGLQAAGASFDARFESTFDLTDKGYSPEDIEVAKELIASILGGIGYFYGSSIVDRSLTNAWDDEDEPEEQERPADARLTDARALFTATPSRPFFPRGFYWDEGFHLLIIGEWDNDLSLAILQDWVNLIDEDGWVGREQILGEEARSKVPQPFWTQYPHHANPPTLTMAVTAFVRRFKEATAAADLNIGSADPHRRNLATGAVASSAAEQLASRHLTSPELGREYLRNIYPHLKRHYNWFRRTQRGQINGRPAGYRWRGRSETHVLTSGLDDYPRAHPPSVGELHLDLSCWMAFFGKIMAEIAEAVGEEEDREEFQQQAESLWTFIDDTHWNEDEQMYCDVSLDEDGAYTLSRTNPVPSNLSDETYHACHRGYISIFPLMLGLVPSSSPRLHKLLDLVSDPQHLWSDYGIRSLSISHPLFGKDEDYWRGAVWIPMNYMVLRSLHNTYARQAGPYQQQAASIYDELRSNVVTNVLNEYKRTGIAWEQYSGVTGEGRRNRVFTGWTSLVALIMAERY